MSDWTPERTAELTRLRSRGFSFERIADVIGMTKDSCLSKARRIGLNTTRTKGGFTLQPLQPGRPRLSNGVNRPHVPLTAYTGPRAGTGCKWPHDNFRDRIRDGREPFCDAPAIEGTSWCLHHRAKVYVRA